MSLSPYLNVDMNDPDSVEAAEAWMIARAINATGYGRAELTERTEPALIELAMPTGTLQVTVAIIDAQATEPTGEFTSDLTLPVWIARVIEAAYGEVRSASVSADASVRVQSPTHTFRVEITRV